MRSSVQEEQGGKNGPNNYVNLFNQKEMIKQQLSVSSKLELIQCQS